MERKVNDLGARGRQGAKGPRRACFATIVLASVGACGEGPSVKERPIPFVITREEFDRMSVEQKNDPYVLRHLERKTAGRGHAPTRSAGLTR